MKQTSKAPSSDLGVAIASLVYSADGWVLVPLDNPKRVRLRMTDAERSGLTLAEGESEAMKDRLAELEVRAATADNGRLF